LYLITSSDYKPCDLIKLPSPNPTLWPVMCTYHVLPTWYRWKLPTQLTSSSRSCTLDPLNYKVNIHAGCQRYAILSTSLSRETRTQGSIKNCLNRKARIILPLLPQHCLAQFLWWPRGMVWGRLLFYRVDLFFLNSGGANTEKDSIFPCGSSVHRSCSARVERRHHRLLFRLFFWCVIPSSFYSYSYVHSSIDSFRKLHGEFAFFSTLMWGRTRR
jgi:hypothetical protein